MDLLGNNSFLLWDILDLDWEWLRQTPEEWDKSASYMEMKEYVCTVKVTNDCAERGVKVKIIKYFKYVYFSLFS